MNQCTFPNFIYLMFPDGSQKLPQTQAVLKVSVNSREETYIFFVFIILQSWAQDLLDIPLKLSISKSKIRSLYLIMINRGNGEQCDLFRLWKKKNNLKLLDEYHASPFFYIRRKSLLPFLNGAWMLFLCMFFLLWNNPCR